MSERNRLRSIGAIAMLNGFVPIRRQPLYLLNILAAPLSFLFFISIASQNALLAYAIGGGMILTMLSIGTSLQSDLTHYRQDLKFQDVLVASPVEAPVYVAGMALSELVYSTPGLLVFVFLWGAGGWANVESAFTLLGVLLLVWAFASALAFTLATYFEDVRESFIFSPLISIGLSVLPPVYYPITYIPEQFRFLAYLAPTTYAAILIHATVGGPVPSLSFGAVCWGVLIAFTAGLFLLAGFKARWRDP